MKADYLFPAVMKKVGYVMFIIFMVPSIFYLSGHFPTDFLNAKTFAIIGGGIFGKTTYFSIVANDLSDELIFIGLSLSLLFISFSREKDEDECISKIRMQSLVWALKVNTLLIILATLFVYGEAYLSFMISFIFTVYVLFIIKFNIALHKFRANDEK